MIRRLAVAALSMFSTAVVLVPEPATAFQSPIAGVVLPPGYEATEYYSYFSGVPRPAACCPLGLEYGNGGLFGDDLFFVDPGTAWPGVGVFRLADLNGDGDANDPGEGTRVHWSVFSGPPPLTLAAAKDIGNGFDNDMFMADDQRNQVWRLSDNSGALAMSVFSGGYWTPVAVIFNPHGNQLLVLDASNFTVFGGGADSRIYALSDTGVRTVWGDSTGTPRGLWDVQSATMNADGWLLVNNAGIVRGVYDREILAYRDNNGDGDARDPGEVKYMASSRTLGQGFDWKFDDNDVLWMAWGSRIMTLEDLNDDGDYWDAAAGDFDPGEFNVWATGFPGFLFSIEFGPNGEMFVGMSNNPSPGSSFKGIIVKIAPTTIDTNQPPSADAGIDMTYECEGPSGARVALDGLLSSDPDDDPLTFSWMKDGALLGEGGMIEVDLPVGVHTIELTVMDSSGETDTDEVVITVEDTTPPEISGVPAPFEVSASGPGGTPATEIDFSGVTAADLCDGAVAVGNDAPAVFPVGSTLVTFTATDAAGNSATAETTVTVVDNVPPVISGVPAPLTVELAGPGGTPSSAVDFSGVTANDAVSGPVPVSNDAPAVFPPGATLVTFTAVDGAGNTATAQTTVTVVDTTAPTIDSVTPSQGIIATPNHRMIPISLSVIGGDLSGVVTSKIIGVTSNEPINGPGDGNTDVDWIITGDLTVELRAERSGNGNGRIYTITVECVDAYGNSAQATTTVTVPKSQGKGKNG